MVRWVAAGSNTVIADTSVAALIDDEDSDTRAKLSAAFGSAVTAPRSTGGDDTSLLQAFINSNTGKIIRFPEETYDVSQLLLPSNTHLDLGRAVIRRTGNTAGASTGATIRNSDHEGNTNVNITVVGGTITGNTGASGRPWSMRGVTNLRVSGIQIEKGSATFADWMFHFENCYRVRADNFQITGGTAVGEDGLHIKSTRDGVFTNFISDVGDDALVLVHEFNQTTPIRDITISNGVLSSRSAHYLRLSVFAGETQAIENVAISNIVCRPPTGGTIGGNSVLINDATNTGLLRRVSLSNIQVDATGKAGNAVTITNVNDSTFTDWRVLGAANRSFLVTNCQRLDFVTCIADTPAVSTGNPQWTVEGASKHVTHIGCEVRDARLWGWRVDGSGTSDITFLGCRALGQVNEAFNVSYAARVTISGCTVDGGGSPVLLNATNPPSIVKIIGNTFTGYTGNPVVNPVATLTYHNNSDLGSSPTTFADVSVGSSSGATVGQSIADAFTTITLSTENSDVGNNFNTTTSIYTVPSTGKYLCVAKVRLTDSAGTVGANLGIGIGTASADGAHFAWDTLPSATRKTFDYQRLAPFTAGEQLRLYTYYSNAGTPVTIANAQMTIVRVE